MKVLVTGASGFIGSVLVDRLVSKGHEVTCLIRDDGKKAKFKQKVEFVVADITDKEKLVAIKSMDIDALFHLAANNPLEKDKKLQKSVNIAGMKNVLDVCANVKLFVYAQGTGVYGDTKGEWIDESAPKKPDTDFAKTRLEAEEMLWNASKENGMAATLAVLGDVYGPAGWFADIIVNRMRNGSFKIPGSGDYYRSFVHVDDVASALVLIAEKNAKNTTYMIVDDEPVTFAEFVYYTADRLGLKKPGKVPALLAKAVLGSDMVKLLTHSMRVRNAKVKNELGLQLKYPTYKEGVTDALQRM